MDAYFYILLPRKIGIVSMKRRASKLIFPFLITSICYSIGWSQQADFIFKKKKSKYEIPFEYKNDFIVLNVLFNDVFPLSFIFDTGAEHTILVKREITDLFQIDYARQFKLYGADMSTTLLAYLAPGITLQTADVRAINRSILVLDEDYLNFEELTGVKVHGILGADFFRRFVVQIDYKKQKIILVDPNKFQVPTKKFIEVPIEINRNKPYINANINFDIKDQVNVKLLIDTGASLALMLYTSTHPDLDIPNKVLNTDIGMGLGGFIEGFIGRVSSFEIDKFNLSDVVTNYQEVVPISDSISLNNRNGLLGNLILKRFDLILDYVNGRLFLSPNKNYKEKFKYDKSGLVIAAGGSELKRIRILKVLEGTPAAQAGILKGDEIIAINGFPTSLLSLGSITRKLRGKTGKKIKLKILRGDSKVQYSFRLKELI